MRTEPTGRTPHEAREVGGPTHCGGCGHPFEVPRFTTSWRQCSCTPGERGHRVWICMRGECRAGTDCPPCTGGEIRNPLAGHDLACWCPLDQPCHADVLLAIAND